MSSLRVVPRRVHVARLSRVRLRLTLSAAARLEVVARRPGSRRRVLHFHPAAGRADLPLGRRLARRHVGPGRWTIRVRIRGSVATAAGPPATVRLRILR
jgi:hypothetical protein